MKQRLNEVVVNGNRVYIENGEVKTQLREDIQRTGWMSLDDLQSLVTEEIKMMYLEKYGKL